ncbi:hypothetical protein D1AOALGA4SA_5136 [Olavius algarvensis Delta 1 endosymbiont]|nr:hypothetical protein D1AOALGA4SA_5136 [Olavius algarvensis Delta 1 endosymbiont]
MLAFLHPIEIQTAGLKLSSAGRVGIIVGRHQNHYIFKSALSGLGLFHIIREFCNIGGLKLDKIN